eukprot:GHRQ01030089.1.p3 GENE.GHRQ01030089.1~~GHRQ01030089.1.p3  ORF type:complete len:113 (+),score=24.90 GHRQ01030089.1:405-743(+)
MATPLLLIQTWPADGLLPSLLRLLLSVVWLLSSSMISCKHRSADAACSTPAAAVLIVSLLAALIAEVQKEHSKCFHSSHQQLKDGALGGYESQTQAGVEHCAGRTVWRLRRR